MTLIPPSWQERKQKSLDHAHKMQQIIQGLGDFNANPDPEFDYLKKAERYAHQALQANNGAVARLANNKPKVTYKPVGTSNVSEFINAIAQQESSGNYGAVNSSSGALGKYQIMPANIPSWSREILGYSISPQQFLNTPSLQDQIAQAKLTNYYNQYGPKGAASAWFSGQPNSYQSSSQVNNYVVDILRRMGIL